MLDLSKYQDMPTDPETILNIATEFNSKGMHELALLFANRCLQLNCNDEIRSNALNVIGISGFYSKDPSMVKLGKNACEENSLNKNVPPMLREVARRNLTFYIKNAVDLMPNVETFGFNFKPKNGYNTMNPSLAVHNGSIWMLQRTVNYVITEHGTYDMQGDTAIRTVNFLIEMTPDLILKSIKQIKMPDNLPIEYKDVIGFEDSRIFFIGNEAWCTSTVRQLSSTGACEMIIAQIVDFDKDECYISNYRKITPQFIPEQNEKNWMPIVMNDNVFFLYSHDPVRICNDNGILLSEEPVSIAADSFRGGGNLVEFEDGWLAVIHESNLMHDYKRRYVHRFVFFDNNLKLTKITESFCFQHIGIEFAPGLAINPDTKKIMVTYGIHDKNSYISIFDPVDIKKILKPI